MCSLGNNLSALLWRHRHPSIVSCKHVGHKFPKYFHNNNVAGRDCTLFQRGHRKSVASRGPARGRARARHAAHACRRAAPISFVPAGVTRRLRRRLYFRGLLAGNAARSFRVIRLYPYLPKLKILFARSRREAGAVFRSTNVGYSTRAIVPRP
ncbi:hypothetical protein EVAR_7839_1 [Eumeta japonica]|uniref:Uncharacterized protein n=1 Tax=Eumeta variegata TaxID=151549 RepID=A0A4C1TVY6_EUMVA|nr:hypothetical protein EVAR_7839_1 [Eumeta japonica]